MKVTGDPTASAALSRGASSTIGRAAVSPPRAGDVAVPSGTIRIATRASAASGICLVAASVFWHVARAGTTSRAPARADEVVLALLAWAGLALTLWLALGMLLGALGHLPGTIGRACAATAERVTPRLVRQLLSLALGASVGTLSLPTGAAAEPHGTGVTSRVATAARLDPGYHPTPPVGTDAVAREADPASSPGETPTDPPSMPGEGTRPSPRAGETTRVPADALPDPGWRPTRPAPALDTERSALLTPAPRLQTATIDTVTVRRGDTLWSIAARHLGADATDAEIAREWPRWYATNRPAVGDDPDAIHPGTQLVPPTAVAP